MIRRGLILISLFIMAALCPAADASASGAKKTVLKNGLTVIHIQKTHLPMVVVNILIKAGAMNEPAGKSGLANLTAGLLTEGTKTRTSTEISDEIEFIGADLGASAGYDYSNVSMSVLKRHVEKGFELMSDVLLNPVFAEAEIEREKSLVKGGLKQAEEQPGFIAMRALRHEVFGDHPYGRLVQGSAESIDRISRNDLLWFYSGHFLPNNAIMTVVGDLNEKELNGLIQKYLGAWHEGPVPAIESVPILKPAKKIILIDKDLTQANILMGHIGVRREDPDYYAISVMNYILGGGGFSSRLMDTIRERMGLSYDVYSVFNPYKESGMFEAGLETSNPNAQKAIAELLKQVRLLREKGATDEELDSAKSFLIGYFPRRMDTMKKIADLYSIIEYYGVGLDFPEKYPALIRAVTKEDVIRVARRYLYGDDYVMIVVAKQSEAKIDTESFK